MKVIKSLDVFENKLMKMFLNGEGNVFSRLKKQYMVINVISREHSDAGFFTNFSLPENSEDLRLDNKSFHIGDIDGSVNGIAGAVGFVLYIKHGAIALLEGYTNALNKWPKSNNEITLEYDSPNKRNIDLIIRA
ncbi:hypothetical protein [Ethanoligenens sp.]|uniref:hypothetical protein n=1 Tax=Ethanoligenens sp. TaxID=2099655 RepID=UPI0039EB5A4D